MNRVSPKYDSKDLGDGMRLLEQLYHTAAKDDLNPSGSNTSSYHQTEPTQYATQLRRSKSTRRY